MDRSTEEDCDEEARDAGEEDLGSIYTPIQKIVHGCAYNNSHAGADDVGHWQAGKHPCVLRYQVSEAEGEPASHCE